MWRAVILLALAGCTQTDIFRIECAAERTETSERIQCTREQTMDNVPRRTQTRAKKAVDKIRKMISEQRQWQGKDPTVVRVNMGDFLALTECNYVRDGKLSGTALEVKAG